MKVSAAEQRAVKEVVRLAELVGYGNLIAHLQTAWAAKLMREYGFDEATARKGAGGPGYPFGMHEDILERGEWDETGRSYRKRA